MAWYWLSGAAPAKLSRFPPVAINPVHCHWNVWVWATSWSRSRIQVSLQGSATKGSMSVDASHSEAVYSCCEKTDLALVFILLLPENSVHTFFISIKSLGGCYKLLYHNFPLMISHMPVFQPSPGVWSVQVDWNSARVLLWLEPVGRPLYHLLRHRSCHRSDIKHSCRHTPHANHVTAGNVFYVACLRALVFT